MVLSGRVAHLNGHQARPPTLLTCLCTQSHSEWYAQAQPTTSISITRARARMHTHKRTHTRTHARARIRSHTSRVISAGSCQARLLATSPISVRRSGRSRLRPRLELASRRASVGPCAQKGVQAAYNFAAFQNSAASTCMVDAAEGGLRAGRLQVDSRASVGVCVQELLVG